MNSRLRQSLHYPHPRKVGGKKGIPERSFAVIVTALNKKFSPLDVPLPVMIEYQQIQDAPSTMLITCVDREQTILWTRATKTPQCCLFQSIAVLIYFHRAVG